MVYECAIDDDVVALTLHCGLATGTVGVVSVGDATKREILLTGSTVLRAGVAGGLAPPRSVAMCVTTWDAAKCVCTARELRHDGDDAEKGFATNTLKPSFRRERTMSGMSTTSATSKRSKLERLLGVGALELEAVNAKAIPQAHYMLLEAITTTTTITVRESPQSTRAPLPLRDSLLHLSAHLPGIVVSRATIGQMGLAEIRVVTTLFFKMHDIPEDADIAMDILQEIFATSLAVVRERNGFVRQFIIDDKGCVLIVCFGVANHTHHNDAVRAVDTALALKQRCCAILRPSHAPLASLPGLRSVGSSAPWSGASTLSSPTASISPRA